MIVTNNTKQCILAARASIASTFLDRFLGLIPRKELAPDEALIFYHAPSIHMFFMRFSIDVIFLDKKMRVLKIYRRLMPWKMAHCFGSTITIELPAGKSIAIPTEVGDSLTLTPERI
ncbi:MAG: DUF192 domain-containing protein [Candidatus Omnitrophica bacterium]|nr:DUF192 domain-containing protein [Candidatus Omnitrophota bacterium]